LNPVASMLRKIDPQLHCPEVHPGLVKV